LVFFVFLGVIHAFAEPPDAIDRRRVHPAGLAPLGWAADCAPNARQSRRSSDTGRVSRSNLRNVRNKSGVVVSPYGEVAFTNGDDVFPDGDVVLPYGDDVLTNGD
jgi:hypothetical protein